MYIFELLVKAFSNKKRKTRFYSPEVSENIVETPEECEHLFMPLDSSNEYFACRNCGLVVPKNRLKNIS